MEGGETVKGRGVVGEEDVEEAGADRRLGEAASAADGDAGHRVATSEPIGRGRLEDGAGEAPESTTREKEGKSAWAGSEGS